VVSDEQTTVKGGEAWTQGPSSPIWHVQDVIGEGMPVTHVKVVLARWDTSAEVPEQVTREVSLESLLSGDGGWARVEEVRASEERARVERALLAREQLSDPAHIEETARSAGPAVPALNEGRDRLGLPRLPERPVRTASMGFTGTPEQEEAVKSLRERGEHVTVHGAPVTVGKSWHESMANFTAPEEPGEYEVTIKPVKVTQESVRVVDSSQQVIMLQRAGGEVVATHLDPAHPEFGERVKRVAEMAKVSEPVAARMVAAREAKLEAMTAVVYLREVADPVAPVASLNLLDEVLVDHPTVAANADGRAAVYTEWRRRIEEQAHERLLREAQEALGDAVGQQRPGGVHGVTRGLRTAREKLHEVAQVLTPMHELLEAAEGYLDEQNGPRFTMLRCDECGHMVMPGFPFNGHPVSNRPGAVVCTNGGEHGPMREVVCRVTADDPDGVDL
jgi:hypothetical protein